MADAVQWIRPGSIDLWIWWSSRLGLTLLGAGLILRLLAPVGRELRRGRCVRCGTAIERGQTYCMDHLQATVNQYRDETRAGALRRYDRRT